MPSGVPNDPDDPAFRALADGAEHGSPVRPDDAVERLGAMAVLLDGLTGGLGSRLAYGILSLILICGLFIVVMVGIVVAAQVYLIVGGAVGGGIAIALFAVFALIAARLLAPILRWFSRR